MREAFFLTLAVGFILSFCYKGIFHKIIACGLVLPIILGFLKVQDIIVSVLILTIIILTIIYGFKELKHNKIKQISMIVFGFALLLKFVFNIMYLPGAGYIDLIVTLSFIFYLISLIVDKKYFTKEIGFMIIWLGYILFFIIQ
jgi:hypothetical protein